MVELQKLINDDAKKLALEHVIIKKRTSGKSLLNSFANSVDFLYEFSQKLQSKPSKCHQLSENWLLDNMDFISDQAFTVQISLKENAFQKLPCLNSGETRIESLLSRYVNIVDGVINEETLFNYIQSYQEISELLIAEIRVISLFMRIVLVKHIAKVMKEVHVRHNICHKVEKIISDMDGEKLSLKTINEALDKSGEEEPLSVAWIVHLVAHSREITTNIEEIYNWVSGRISSQMSINELIDHEHKLQVSHELKTGNFITSLRTNERMMFEKFFQKISIVDKICCDEPLLIYKKMDLESRSQILTEIELVAFERRIPEITVAKNIVQLAKAEYIKGYAQVDKKILDDSKGIECECTLNNNDEVARKMFIAYYLFETKGQKKLLASLNNSGRLRKKIIGNIFPVSTKHYFSYIIFFMTIFTILLLSFLEVNFVKDFFTSVLLLGFSLFVAHEWMITWLHSIIEFFIRPRPLLRYDFSSGVPACAKTIVVMPVIWNSFEDVERLVHKLEIHHLSCRDESISFALLADFHDIEKVVKHKDRELVIFAREKILELNERYSKKDDKYFHLFHRTRQWNDSEQIYMGWERKRGKLVEFVELLHGKYDTSFINDPDWNNEKSKVNDITNSLKNAKYIITLDEDTSLPMGNAHRMIATMHFPYNRPKLNKNKTRVIDGYAILQPRVGVSLETSLYSKLSSWWTEPGWDPYAYATTDPYQDSVGQGIFIGKGIFDVSLFLTIIKDRIPDNKILSHDLLEGSLLRTGFLSDIELVDDHPNRFITFQKRIHRWVRGDWQLLSWLFPKSKNRSGESVKTDLDFIHRWQILENIRRSLAPIVYFVALLLSLNIFSKYYKQVVIVVIATILLPILKKAIAVLLGEWKKKSLTKMFMQAFVNFIILPYQATVMGHAIFVSLYRQFISKKYLLEWVSSSAIEKKYRQKKNAVMMGILGGYLLNFCFLLCLWLGKGFNTFNTSLIILWAIAPFLMWWWDKEIIEKKAGVPKSDRLILQTIAKDTWQYYEDFANESNNWLPPDNVQIDPDKGVAPRTSPTNIGYLLTSIIAAHAFDWISTKTAVIKISLVLNTIEQLEKCQGHLFNWYNTQTLEPLPPKYVSTVDSGNYVASLMATKQAVIEFMEDEDDDEKIIFYKDVIERLENNIINTDFKFLYNGTAKLFYLGYNAITMTHDDVLYDLLASEARQASFVAIALGQVSISHWASLGRTTKKQGKYISLLSWSGTIFEYLMPWQLMRTYKETVWDNTYKGIVKAQIEYANRKGIPYGISESGYYAFDYQMNYQYYAFGVPSTGFRNSNEDELVMSPYATIMTLPYAPEECLRTLGHLDNLGARGKYGFYEAIDYTEKRIPENYSYMIVKSFMAHHQGMILLTITNFLKKNIMINYFHRDVRVQSAEMLLKERAPVKASVVHTSKINVDQKLLENRKVSNYKRRFDIEQSENEINIHANDRLTSIITNEGEGVIQYDGIAITRFREHSTEAKWGSFFYISDRSTQTLFSLTEQPCQNSDNTEITSLKKSTGVFSLGHSDFSQKIANLKTDLSIWVGPTVNAEFRKIKIQNMDDEPRTIDCTSFIELALSEQMTDQVHPAFNKLFIETFVDPDLECLLAHRRSRSEQEQNFWAYHSLFVTKDERKYRDFKLDNTIPKFEFETDRGSFIGRGGSLAYPINMFTSLLGTTGAVTDPAFIIRRSVTINPGETVTLICMTGVADTREEALLAVKKYRNHIHLENSFRLAWTRGQIELNHFRISQQELALFNKLAGCILFSRTLTEKRKLAISNNTLEQKNLWSLGISGDYPIVLVKINSISNLTLVKKLIIGQEYFNKVGLKISFVFLYEVKEESYQQTAEDALKKLVYKGGENNGHIHLVAKKHINESLYRLLVALARIVIHSDGASLFQQLNMACKLREIEKKENKKNYKALPHMSIKNIVGQMPEAHKDITFFNGIGGFSYSGHEYHCLLSINNYPSLPWSNVLANPIFGTLTTEKYSGYTWGKNSREFKLTPWSNDPVIDEPSEACYIRDEESGKYWRVGDYKCSECRVTYGQGYTTYLQKTDNISHKMTIFVSKDKPVKFIKLRFQNNNREPRSLSVTYYANWVLGAMPHGATPMIATSWLEDVKAIMVTNTYEAVFRNNAFLATPGEVNSFCGGDFIGKQRKITNPQALDSEMLANNEGVFVEPGSAVQQKIMLKPGQKETIFFILGCAESETEVKSLVKEFADVASCEQELIKGNYFWKQLKAKIWVNTPSLEMNFLLNNWLLYQTLACRIWARTAFYQAGGAYGFRDQLQDTLALLHHQPDIARKQILLNASHQYVEGDVQHWWHEETSRGIRTKFSDDLHWLPYAVIRYIEQTEDEQILYENVPYIRSEPLKDNEYERYEETVLSDEVGTIYDHCVRALKRGCNFGKHNLPLMGIGDWNDGMSHVGAEGIGESVWLGWFLGYIFKRFIPICEKMGDKVHSQYFHKHLEKLEKSLNSYAWDGKWYRRAYHDGGFWLGTHKGQECKIDAIAQSWSILSEIGDSDKVELAMKAFDQHLVDRKLKLARLLTPGFNKTSPSPGYIQGYPAGIRENGGQYSHGVIWSILAYAKLKRGDKAFDLFNMLNPINHTKNRGDVKKYKGEPFVMSADVYTAKPHEGRSGWTWYTGAAGWMYQAGLEGILGFKRRGTQLIINPCIPAEWSGFTLTYIYEQTEYNFIIKNNSGEGHTVKNILLDDSTYNYTSQDDGGALIPLINDKNRHNITVEI